MKLNIFIRYVYCNQVLVSLSLSRASYFWFLLYAENYCRGCFAQKSRRFAKLNAVLKLFFLAIFDGYNSNLPVYNIRNQKVLYSTPLP